MPLWSNLATMLFCVSNNIDTTYLGIYLPLHSKKQSTERPYQVLVNTIKSPTYSPFRG